VVVIQQIINIILNFIFIRFFEINGIAIATSIASFAGSMMMLYMFRQNFGRMKLKTTIISLGKITLLSLLMALLANKVYAGLAPKLPMLVAILITLLVAVVFYGFFILLARIPEVMNLVNSIYHKRKNKKKRIK
jgi:putative peptidoglycan lipid II flippase